MANARIPSPVTGAAVPKATAINDLLGDITHLAAVQEGLVADVLFSLNGESDSRPTPPIDGTPSVITQLFNLRDVLQANNMKLTRASESIR